MYKKIIILLVSLTFIAGCTGKTSVELYTEGMKLLHEGNSNGAIVFFRNALDKDQNHLDARHQLARAYLLIGKYQLAEKELQKVMRLNPSQPEVQLELAKVYNAQQKPDQAISQAKGYLATNPDSADALESLGIAYSLKNEPQLAETFFLRSLQLNPEKITVKLELAALNIRQGKAVEAKKMLEDVLKDNIQHSRAQYLLADAEITLGQKDKALAIYKKLTELNSADPIARYKYTLLGLEMGAPVNAGAAADELIIKFPKKGEGYRLKGIVSYYNKDFVEAIAALQNANRVQPTVVGHYFLGLSLYNKGELENALSQFRLILDRNPSFNQARLLAGVILLQQQRTDDAISELTKLLEYNENSSQAHTLLGSAYMVKGMYEEGIKELDKAIDIEPRHIEAYLRKGVFLLSQGKNAEVEVNLTKALKIAPKLVGTRLALASFYEHQNYHDKAVATLKSGLTGSKSDADLYCGMARILFAHNPSEAQKLIQKAKELNPDSVAPHIILASYYAGNREVGKALDEYSAVCKKEPGNANAMLRMGILLESVGRENEAVALYQKAKETHNATAYIALSRYYEKKGNADKALATLVELGQYLPRSVDLLEQKVRLYLKKAQFNDAFKVCDDIEAISAERAISKKVSVYMAMKKQPEALREAGRAITLKPNSLNGYMLLASVHQEQGNIERAIETLKKGVRLDRNNPQADLYLASLYDRAGNHALSVKTCDEILRKRPHYAPAYYAQGTFLEAKGNKNEAIKKYRAAVARSPNYAAPLNNLAYLYLNGFGSKEEALRLAERANTLEPEDPRILDTLGYALLKNNRYQEARQIFARALAQQPVDPTINYHLALAYKTSGETKLAKAHLQTALRSGSFAGIQQAKDLLAEIN